MSKDWDIPWLHYEGLVENAMGCNAPTIDACCEVVRAAMNEVALGYKAQEQAESAVMRMLNQMAGQMEWILEELRGWIEDDAPSLGAPDDERTTSSNTLDWLIVSEIPGNEFQFASQSEGASAWMWARLKEEGAVNPEVVYCLISTLELLQFVFNETFRERFWPSISRVIQSRNVADPKNQNVDHAYHIYFQIPETDFGQGTIEDLASDELCELFGDHREREIASKYTRQLNKTAKHRLRIDLNDTTDRHRLHWRSNVLRLMAHSAQTLDYPGAEKAELVLNAAISDLPEPPTEYSLVLNCDVLRRKRARRYAA